MPTLSPGNQTEYPAMKIGVISDTHIKEPSHQLRKVMETVFRDADLILHAGDIVSLQVLKAFEGKRVIAVRGNMDLPDSVGILNDQEIIVEEGKTIGIIHGWGSPIGLEKKIRQRFGPVDAIVYGHSHRTANHVKEGVLFFNPGSFKAGWFNNTSTVGILTVGDTIRGEIIEV